MNPTTFRAAMTTSWDDGHPLDFRVAELLSRYELDGTFYIPRRSQRPTMTETQVRELSHQFEIGAHTMDHLILTHLNDADARRQIADSKTWVEQVTGQPCLMFCPPTGRYALAHLDEARKQKYVGWRTVEFMSCACPRVVDGLCVMPTTLQAHPHRAVRYVRNFVKRGALGNFWNWIVRGHCHSGDWPRLATAMLEHVRQTGGVFHLWGHSWELEEAGQWQRLETVLGWMQRTLADLPCLTNGGICRNAVEGEMPCKSHVATGQIVSDRAQSASP